ncbi:membrane or secreted protein [Vicingus serpentipes]|uniref:Membrane or secreted protein n=1 Tax=Vicingus serpentipes TaxID=1926625 RepID=A0A5C6RVG3_9FLAO|nr:membrane or secreted protein [Vicingus serpentipes]TXB65332.1 membrane or secreted protein [Vicingus serpentipes]
MKLALLVIGLLAMGVFGMAVKIIFKKDGKFDKTCASVNTVLNKDGEPCGLCGAAPEEQCKKEEVEAA